MSESLKIDVWSDIACPWCYIGKRKLEAGIAASTAQVEVEYHSFELSPDTPVDFDGTEAEYLSQHKGVPVVQAEEMLGRMTGIAAEVGLQYDFDALRHVNTVKAHQVIHQAKAEGRQLDMVERLFSAYFEEGRQLGQDDELADLAEEIGLDRDAVLAELQNDTRLAAVRADQEQAEAFGITGVPFFVIDGKYGVSGAQEASTFVQVLERVLELRAEAGAEPGADSHGHDANGQSASVEAGR